MQGPQEILPERIGHFRIVRLLGDGAQGRVYLAEEDEPRREIALKVLRNASAQREFQQRFLREIEVLARLEHPAIARVYSAGTADTPAGRVPYLAMEYVRGTDLASHCTLKALPLRERLRLLVEICAAVHHAHTRGVIHRDLKPGNILMDPEGRPKVLDFGVAHVASDEREPMTVAGQVLGTLTYMSPELLGGAALNADPRSDVYSLGAIAYELVGGAPPYPALANSTILAAIDLVRSGAPPRLSALAPVARGDLETIVMKALAADPAQRYGSAAELGADLQRYLQDRPIEARPPTAMYVTRLFVRRHRALAAGIGVAAIGLVAAAALSLSFALSELHARHEAETRAAETTAINQFLEKMLTAADPEHTRGAQLTVRELLDQARKSLVQDRSLPPAVGGALRLTMSGTYRSLGLLEPALQLNGEALNLAGAGAEVALKAHVAHAMMLGDSGKVDEAEQELRAALQQLPPARGEAQRLRIEARNVYAVNLLELGRLTEGEKFLRELLTEAERTLGPEQSNALDVAQNLAAVQQALGRLEQALKLEEIVVERLDRTLGADAPAALAARAWLSMMYRDRADPRAEETVRAVYADRGRILGADHPDTLQSESTMVSVLLLDGRADEAEKLARDLIARNLKLRGAQHLDTLLAKTQLGEALAGRGRRAEAAQLFREVNRSAAALPGGAHPLLLSDGLALALMESGQLAQAQQEFDALLARSRKQLPADHPKLARFMSSAAECLRRQGRVREARALLEPAYATLLAKNGAAHPRTREAGERLRALNGGA